MSRGMAVDELAQFRYIRRVHVISRGPTKPRALASRRFRNLARAALTVRQTWKSSKRHRFIEEIPLRLGSAHFPQYREWPRILDALCDDRQTERFRHSHDRCDNCTAAGARGEFEDKRLVDLQTAEAILVNI